MKNRKFKVGRLADLSDQEVKYLKDSLTENLLKNLDRTFKSTYRHLSLIVFTLIAVLIITWKEKEFINLSLFGIKSKSSESVITDRIHQLDGVKSSLKDIIEYIESEKITLGELEQNVNKAKADKNELDTLNAADKEALRIFYKQISDGDTFKVWVERIISFILGVLSSLVASVLWFKYVRRKLEKSESE